MHACTQAGMHACMHAWMDGWMDGWTVLYGCMGALMSACMSMLLCILAVGRTHTSHTYVQHLRTLTSTPKEPLCLGPKAQD